MNKQDKKGIGWCDYTWNPIKGMCPVNCKLPDGKEYCYARKMYKRFKWNPELRFALDDPIEIDKLLNQNIPDGSKVFVCSTIELFHPEIKKEWRDTLFSIIKNNPSIVFQILTKMPENIDREMPDNVHLGVTITGNDDEWRTDALIKTDARIKFISHEPMLSDCKEIIYSFDDISWLILGRLTGHGKKYDPTGAVLEDFANATEKYKIPLFMKENLKEIWGNAPLIQEFPQE